MQHPFKRDVELVKADVFTRLPERFRRKGRNEWTEANRGGIEVECFLEGPCFDRAGNLWVVDIPFGRIFRIDPNGEWDLVTQYDGWPNGMKIHRDGRHFVCDYREGLLALDPKSARLETLLVTFYSESFKGLNDLHFAANGDLYFTDQGQTGCIDPTGRVFRLRANGVLECLASNVPGANGITLSGNDRQLYVAATGVQQVWRLPLMANGVVTKSRVALQFSGGIAGPDGIEMDAEDGLLVCHLGVGVYRFDARMLPTHLVYSDDPKHLNLANIAFGGEDRRTLYIVQALTGEILTARLPVAGKRLYGHH
ncbi:MAG TPA: SMP-30/gluconolactonase/LRE family protein [Burkholderiales bacterium]|nr:SMP-30/gluconolactonase/LRE family protein [Burkholderiales bacterium]